MGNLLFIDAKSANYQAYEDKDLPFLTFEILKCMYKINIESKKGFFMTSFVNLNENTLRYLQDRGYLTILDTSTDTFTDILTNTWTISWGKPTNNLLIN